MSHNGDNNTSGIKNDNHNDNIPAKSLKKIIVMRFFTKLLTFMIKYEKKSSCLSLKLIKVLTMIYKT